MTGKCFLFSLCALGASVFALAISGARAATVGGSASAIVFDDPGSVTTPDPITVPCTTTPGIFCVTNPSAQVTGPHTSATANTAVDITRSSALPTGSSVLFPTGATLLLPQIAFFGSASAQPSVNSSTSAGITGTGQWSIGGSIFQPLGASVGPSFSDLKWTTKFTFDFPSAVNSLFNFTFDFAGVSLSSAPFNAEVTGSMTCTGGSCSTGSGNPNFRMLPGTNTIDAFFDLAGCNCDTFTLSETVTYQADVRAGDGKQTFDFVDPTILALLDSSGNVIPNLFLYDSSSNGLLGLSGQDFSATTPVPAALPLFATGLGLMGLLGWRRKRKAQAGAA